MIKLEAGERLETNPATGLQYITGGKSRSPIKSLPKPKLSIKFPVEGLEAVVSSMAYCFVWVRAEPIDEADARDAQCRAGYSDTGFGFFGFSVYEAEGKFHAAWCSWNSCE